MLSKLTLAARLARRDWQHEAALSLCAVLALAGMLAPLLVLVGVRNGVVETMREKLLQDPVVLVITPAGSATDFPPSFIEELRGLPGARFAIGRTRDIAADITVRTEAGKSLSVQMEPCAPGEPVLEHYGLAVPQDGGTPDLVLSARAAATLGVQAGAVLVAPLGRRTPEGRLESLELRFRVSGVLPERAGNRNLGFLPQKVLQDIQDYRDYIRADRPGFEGREAAAERPFASFRLYARDLDAVETLSAALAERGIEARTKAREIAGIRQLAQAINSVILVIALAVGAGFAAFTLSSVQGAVRRKDRMLGMLRLLGFPKAALLLYPLVQTLLTALCGIAVAGLLYLAVSLGIDRLFAQQSGGLALCRLSVWEMLAAAGIVLALSALASARAARQAAGIEPSAVIREV